MLFSTMDGCGSILMGAHSNALGDRHSHLTGGCGCRKLTSNCSWQTGFLQLREVLTIWSSVRLVEVRMTHSCGAPKLGPSISQATASVEQVAVSETDVFKDPARRYETATLPYHSIGVGTKRVDAEVCNFSKYCGCLHR